MGFPSQQSADYEQREGEHAEPASHEKDVAGGGSRDASEQTLRTREGKTVEGHDSPADKTHEGALPDEAHLEASREPPLNGIAATWLGFGPVSLPGHTPPPS